MNALRNSIVAACIAGTVSGLTGCASMPSPDVMKAEVATFQLPRQPEPGRAIVYVVRPSAMGAFVRFNVFVDDKEPSSEVGYTRAGQYIHFELSPGDHRVYSKAENWAEASLTVKAGQVIYLQQEPAMGLIMARNSLVQIEDVQGKYQVKKLTLGSLAKAGS